MSFVKLNIFGTTFEVTTRYVDLQPVEMGIFGLVCSAKDQLTGQSVAIKQIVKPFSNPVSSKRKYRELKLLKDMQHENIIGLEDVFISPLEDLYFVTELFGTDLHRLLTSRPLEKQFIQYFLYQILRGLKYVHSAGVVHRNLKPSNILVNENCDVKICDFGSARVQGPQMTGYVSTRYYRAPEIMLTWEKYDVAVDIWSTGCIFAEMLEGKPLFPGKDHVHQFSVITELLGTPPDDIIQSICSENTLRFVRSLPKRDRVPFSQKLLIPDPDALDLLERMLVFDPRERIDATQSLAHPYMAPFHDPSDEPVAAEKFDWSFDDADLPVDTWKVMMYGEILAYHESTEDEGYPGVPQAPPTALELQALGDRDARNREAARDSKPSILTASPTIDHSPMEANEDDHDILKPLSATPEYPSIDHAGDVQSGEAGHPDLIPEGASSITAELQSVDRGDRVVQQGDAPSMLFFQGSPNVETLFDDGKFTNTQRNLICDYIANPTVLPDIKNNLRRRVLTQSTMILPRAEAMYNDNQTKKNNGPCFEGTRVALLREMAHWFTSPDGFKMYVLYGLAGIGKSTVAYTIASRVADLDLLGASFFFLRDDTDCNNAKMFFTTIAYQLCAYNETFAKAIGDVLNTERGAAATTKDPQEQLQALILEPLRGIVQSRVRPILVVVDALNECDGDGERAVVKGLSRLIRELPSFKVILTTRPQPSLDPFFGSQGGHKFFHLQDIEDKVVDGDIRLYFKHYLSLLQVQTHHPKQQWCASDEEIESLVRASRRHFIIASRTVRYILDESASDPAAQMQKLLHAFAQGRMPFKDLDEIQQDFDMNFGREVFGWGTIVGILMAILVHRR